MGEGGEAEQVPVGINRFRRKLNHIPYWKSTDSRKGSPGPLTSGSPVSGALSGAAIDPNWPSAAHFS